MRIWGWLTDEEWEASKARYLAAQKREFVGFPSASAGGITAAELCPDCGLLKLAGMDCAACLMAKTAAVPELMTLGVNSSTLQFRARELDGESIVEMGSGQSWVMIAKFPGAFGSLRADSYVKFMETNGRR